MTASLRFDNTRSTGDLFQPVPASVVRTVRARMAGIALLTVSSTIISHSYIPGGAMLSESLAGLVAIEADDLIVKLASTGAVQVLGTHYEITGNLRTGAASIRTLVAYGAGLVLTVTRRTDRTQEAAIPLGQPLPSAAVELELDRQTLIVQEQDASIAAGLARAWLVPDGELGGVLPPRATLAGRLIAADGDGSLVAGASAGLVAALVAGAAPLALPAQTVLASVIAMTALAKAGLTDGAMVFAAGRGALGDGGGGTFTWNAASGVAADGGTVFAADAGGAGRWIRVTPERWLNARWFNLQSAVAATAAAGYLAFIAALNAAGASRIGVVPSGDYVLDSATLAAAPAVVTRDRVCVTGEGMPSITNSGGSIVTALLQFNDCGGRVSGIRWVGNNQGDNYTNGSAVRFVLSAGGAADVEDCRVEGCQFDNFKTPYWVEFLNQSAVRTIRAVKANGNFFASRNGNSIGPASVAWNASAICVNGNPGLIEAAEVAGNVVNARWIKSGVQVFHKVRTVAVTGNTVFQAGLDGATDDAGAYGLFVYCDNGEGTNATIAGNTVTDARSMGIYVRGDWPGTLVADNLVSGVTDTNVTSLPKGGIIFNAAMDFECSRNTISGAAKYGIYSIPNALLDTASALFDGNRVSGGERALMIAMANRQVANYRIDGFTARDFTGFGILLFQYDPAPAGLTDAVLTRLHLTSAGAGTYGVGVQPNGATLTVPGLAIGGASFIATAAWGVQISAVAAAHRIAIHDIELKGPFTSRGLGLDALKKVSVGKGVRIRGHNAGAGFACGFANTEGTLEPIEFVDCDDTKLIAISGTDMGINAPGWAGNKGQFVANLNLATQVYGAGPPVAGMNYLMPGYRCTGGAVWKEVRELTT